jgi:hypothetical protein
MRSAAPPRLLSKPGSGLSVTAEIAERAVMQTPIEDKAAVKVIVTQ